MKKWAVSIALAIMCSGVVGQESESTAVSSIDGIVNEVLETISGDSTVTRDVEKLRMLFAPDATLRVLAVAPDGSRQLRTFNLEEFARIVRDFYSGTNFYEYGLNKTVDEYNGIAQVFQGYEVDGPRGKEQGINSYQLYFDGERWWITSILWVSDRNGEELPEEYR